jgi:hypothetical protein
MQYAVLNAEGKCINRILWDGITPWSPPKGCQAIADPDNKYSSLPDPPANEEEEEEEPSAS